MIESEFGGGRVGDSVTDEERLRKAHWIDYRTLRSINWKVAREAEWTTLLK